MSLWKRSSLVLAAVATASLTYAHDDDPKVLDFQKPIDAPIYRTGAPSVYGPGEDGPGTNLNATSGGGFASSGVQLMSWIPTTGFGGAQNGNSCWGYTSPSGREYALMGLQGKTGFVEITNPGNPVIIAQVVGPFSTWRNIKVYEDHAYIVSEGGDGIQVVDMSDIDNGNVTLVNTVLSGGTEATHTSWINTDTGRLYRSGGGSNGLRIYDLSDTANPVHSGSWSDRYSHAVTTFLYTTGPYAGKEIAFSCGGFNGGQTSTGLTILDVTDASNVQVIKQKYYSGSDYAHQAYPSDDMQYLYLSDELDENGAINTTTKVFDISNLSNPIELPDLTNDSKAISHNFFVKGDLLFEANYRSGLRIFDKTNQAAPTEIAFFDTWPDDDNAAFNGLWNTYPFFPSGTVIGSDVERGLFVWWIGAPLVDFTFPNGAPEVVNPAGETFEVEVASAQPGDLMPGTAMMHYDVGAGWVTTPLSNLGGDLFEATLPATACATAISYYFTAESSNGITWTEPEGGPNSLYLATSAQSYVVVNDVDIESNPNWSTSVPSDKATGGIWERGNPIGTIAQPEDDHTQTPGKKCYYTGNANPTFVPAVNDVDDGKTTLTTTEYDLTGMADPYISYWRWFSNSKGNNPGEDVFTVGITNGITAWIDVEEVGPVGPEVHGGWIKHSFRVADFVAPTANVRVRFVARDDNNQSLVEAAIDDFRVVDIDCGASAISTYCTAGTTASGCTAAMSTVGVPSATSASGFVVGVTGVEGEKDGLIFFGVNGRQANAWGSGTSFQCVVPPVRRTGLQAGNGTSGACDGVFNLDFNSWMTANPGKAPAAGAVAQMQTWFRDPQNTSNQSTSLSDALEFTIAP